MERKMVKWNQNESVQLHWCVAWIIPSSSSHCSFIVIILYTVGVYTSIIFYHNYKNKIQYCGSMTIHTRWKQNTQKLYSPHWGQRYAHTHTLTHSLKQFKKQKSNAQTLPSCNHYIFHPDPHNNAFSWMLCFLTNKRTNIKIWVSY